MMFPYGSVCDKTSGHPAHRYARVHTPLSHLITAPTLDHAWAYFEVVVDAVRAEGGDVLKFVGDGVLSIFEVTESGRAAACAAAVRAASQAVARARAEGLPTFVGALHVGLMMYGNIGSLNRLDFTVVGLAVNIVSRLEEIAKASGQTLVCSGGFASDLPVATVRNIGQFELRGLSGEHDVFTITSDQGNRA
jgi:adenylate cyclase